MVGHLCAVTVWLYCKAWFSLAHKQKHKYIRTRRMAYLTQFSIRALLKPMINKMADEASGILLLICSHEVWDKVTYDWSAALCLCLCLSRPRSQSYDISISVSTLRTKMSVFLVLMLCLCRRRCFTC